MDERPVERAKNASEMTGDEQSVELSRRRTGMSFQRTRMSADRTLMSVIRTSLSLISFGFTIYQFFQKLRESQVLRGTAYGARNFGTSLLLLGVAMLVVGIIYHVAFMKSLRDTRNEMKGEGLIHGESQFPASLTLIVAILLLAIGILATVSIWSGHGPFG